MTKEEEKKKFLLDLREEINELKKKIYPKKKDTVKRDFLYGTRLSLKFLQHISPYILSIALSLGFVKLVCKSYPFVIDDEKKYLLSEQTIDEEGRIINERKHYINSEEDYQNSLIEYCPWYIEDNEYRRVVNEYELRKKTPEEIIDYYKDNNLDDLLKKSNNKVEIKESNSYEEVESKLQITTYNLDKDKYIIGPETKFNNFNVSFIYVFFVIISEVLAAAYRSNYPRLTNDYLQSLKNTYYLSDEEIERLKILIKIKEDNYKVLTRGIKDGK